MADTTGETIRQLREAAGLSRQELAHAADISQVSSANSRRESQPSSMSLTKIAKAHDLSVGELTAKIAVFEATGAPTDHDMKCGRRSSVAAPRPSSPPVSSRASAWLRQRPVRPRWRV